jgi:acylphosphatase
MNVHVFISGFVQGVGFRRFVRHHALELGLTGWVKNLSDNRVETVFQSSTGRRYPEGHSDQEAKERIEKMISICKKGPFLSEVKEVVVDWEDKTEEIFKTFEITH